MNDERFWQLIEGVPESRRGLGDIGDALVAELARLPIPRIGGFQRTLLDKVDELLTWPMWEAADIIHRDSCSSDFFIAFRLWVVAQGEAVFSAAVGDPDALARHPAVMALAGKPQPWSDADYPHRDELMSVAELAFDAVLAKLPARMADEVEAPDTLDDRPGEVPMGAAPADFNNVAAVRRRLPGLIRLFGQGP